MRKVIIWVAFATGLAASATAAAAIIEGPVVGGFGTFQDTNTGRIWADLDSFGSSIGALDTRPFVEKLGELIAVGFALATKADVLELVGSMPLTPNVPQQWLGYAAVTGYVSVIPDSILGSYLDDNGTDPAYGVAYADLLGTHWTFDDDRFAAHEPDGFTPFAYRQSAVPVPGSPALLLLGGALCAVVTIRSHRKRSMDHALARM